MPVLLRPLRPVARRFNVTNPFGRKGNYSAGYHTGVDYGAPMGTPVRAPRAGRVTQAGWNGDYGLSVTVKDWRGRKSFLLAHLSRVKVKQGRPVFRGQVVGLTGDTGNSSGPHLHAEQRKPQFGYWDHEKPDWE